MKWMAVVGCLLAMGCAVSEEVRWTLGEFKSRVPHAPDTEGYKSLKSESVGFREYRLHHPEGLWRVKLDAGEPPIELTTADGEKFTLDGEWYPEEGGADAAAAYGFVKGGETLIVLQGTSDLTYEETWVKFVGGTMSDVKRYASKGLGMGPGAPGVEPKYRIYPEP